MLAHQPALFLIHDGIVSLCAEAANGKIVTTVSKANNRITLFMQGFYSHML